MDLEPRLIISSSLTRPNYSTKNPYSLNNSILLCSLPSSHCLTAKLYVSNETKNVKHIIIKHKKLKSHLVHYQKMYVILLTCNRFIIGYLNKFGHCWWEYKLLQTLWKRVWRFLKIKNRTIIWSSNHTSGYTTKGSKIRTSKRSPCSLQHYHNSQDKETT